MELIKKPPPKPAAKGSVDVMQQNLREKALKMLGGFI